MTAPLTLPGSIPGLIRRCSPVMLSADESVVFGLTDTVALVMTSGKALKAFGVSALALDLTDATGRAHASWWLRAGKFWAEPTGMKCFVVDGGLGGGLWHVPSPTFPESRHVPSLADLDPNDPRLLDDGSRWVDAEALRRVCLHVAGLEVSP